MGMISAQVALLKKGRYVSELGGRVFLGYNLTAWLL